ncbi:MAG: hypothetical protein WHT08_14560 [Bryobacteraceae bacterium]
MRLLAVLLTSWQLFALDNHIKIHEASGSTQASRPFTALMVFMQGEFPLGTYPKPRINGTPASSWQVDVKNRWPDGSILTAFVSFPVSLPANGQATVDFVPDPNSCHLGDQQTCEAAALDQSGMLNFLSGNWNAQIRGTANSIPYTTDAKTMIAAGAWRYWLRGPVVTRVIVEDMSTALAYDFGWRWDGTAWQAPTNNNQKGIHPMFEISFYPGWSGVEIGYKLENSFRTRLIKTSSNGRAAFQFLLEFLAGSPASVVYSKTNFNLTTMSGVTYWAWSGSAPGKVLVDRNLPYLVATRVLPSYDLNIRIDQNKITTYLNQWPGNVGTDDQGRPDPRSCTTSNNPCAYIKTDMPGTGDSDNFGIIPGFHISYLYAMGDNRFSVATRMQAFERLIEGSAEAAVNIPMHTREGYTNMSPAWRNYLNWPEDQQTPSFGRIFSLSAQPEGRTGIAFDQTGPYPAQYACTSCPASNKPWVPDGGHWPSLFAVPYILTGRYLYIATAQQFVAALMGGGHPEYDRHWDWGIVYDSANPRGPARVLKDVYWTWLLSPDSPERNYFASKLKNVDAAYEGVFDIRDGLYSSQIASDCRGSVVYNITQTFNSTHECCRPNGQRKVFTIPWRTLISLNTVAVNGVTKTFGIYGQDTGKDWYWIPGTGMIIQDPNATPLSASDSLYIAGEWGRNATPWCRGYSLMGNLTNPLALPGLGQFWAELEGAAGVTGTSPWMWSYFSMHVGWIRQTRALAVNGGYLFEKSGAKLGKFYVDGILHPRKPVLYSAAYRTPTTDALGLITTWERYIAVRNPPVALASPISATSTSLTLNCAAWKPGCIGVKGRMVIKIDDEYIATCGFSHTDTNTTLPVCPNGRGFWGTKAAPHTTSSVINAEWRMIAENLSGHTYDNLWVNALAMYHDVEGTLGSGLAAYERAISMGAGLHLRASDQRYALVPRVEPYRLRVTTSPGKAEITYDAPTLAACRYAITPGYFASSDDSNDTADRGGPRTRRIVLDGLAPGEYRYRVTCGTGRVNGSFTVPAAP